MIYYVFTFFLGWLTGIGTVFGFTWLDYKKEIAELDAKDHEPESDHG